MDATLSSPVERPDLSAAKSRAFNDPFAVFGTYNYVYSRKPDYYIYLYNYSEMEFIVSRPPLFQDAKFGGRKAGEEAHYLGKLPQPLNIPKGNVDSGEVDPITQDTRRFVMDMINPDNLGINQDAFIERSTSGGTNDLGAKGLFWSYNGPGNSKNGTNPDGTEAKDAPTAEEILAARKRMEKRYRFILNEAKTVEVSSPKDLPDKVTPELHAAAEYFGETYSWHNKQIRADYCPSCGEKMRAGAAFHKTEDGGYCVLDWDRAIKAGARTRAQAFEATEDPKYAPKVVSTVTAEGLPQGTATHSPKGNTVHTSEKTV